MSRKSDRIPLLERLLGTGGWWDRVNTRLVPLAGPAAVGPYDTEPEPERQSRPCPLCRQPMDRHTFDRSGPKPLMHCP